jgi:type IV secretory pathway VirB10-like protein
MVVRQDLVDRPPVEQTMVGTPSTDPDALRYPSTYLQPQGEPPRPQAATTPTATKPEEVQAPGARVPAASPGSLPPAPPRPPRLDLPAGGQREPQPGMPPPASAARPSLAKKDIKRWFSTVQPPQGDILAPPFPDDPKEQAHQSKLFPKAVWERPADPYKVLYWDQTIQGQLYQDINSDIPGTFLIKVTEDVKDRWGHGHMLIPLDTVLLGRQDGQSAYNQERLPATVLAGIFPDGSSINWEGQTGDSMGAKGIPADVNNHWGRLLLGVGLQAILNLSVRGASGATGIGSYQQSLPQEAAQDVTRGLNQAGQKVLEQFQVRPTLTQKHGYPVTVSFTRNVSFMSSPVVAHQ